MVRYPHKRLLTLDDELKKRIADYRFAHRFTSEADAVRDLLRRGLAQVDKTKKGRKD